MRMLRDTQIFETAEYRLKISTYGLEFVALRISNEMLLL